MVELRTFIERLREQTGVPYPLAHAQPLVSGRSLILEAQEQAHLDPEYRLVLHVDNQLVLSYTAERFMERVVWEGDVATGWRAHSAQSPVTVQPDVRFGRPAVSGVSTVSVFEQAEAGASHQELAEDFGLTIADVRWALSYENERHAVA